ncbi:flagellar protein FlgN [Calditrichota bacterium LG25]
MSNLPLTSNESTKTKLFQLLLEEIHAYSYLAETVKQKQEAIIKNNLQTMENLSGVERLLVKKVELMLQTREKYLNELLSNTNPDLPLQLDSYIEQLPLKEQARWRSLQQRISRTVDKIRRLNRENQQLVQSSLNYVRGVIEMLYAMDQEAVLYTSNGQEQKAPAGKQVVNYNV